MQTKTMERNEMTKQTDQEISGGTNFIEPEEIKYYYYISFTATKLQDGSWGVCNAFTHYESNEPLNNMDAIFDAKNAIEEKGAVDGGRLKNVIINNFIPLDRRFRETSEDKTK